MDSISLVMFVVPLLISIIFTMLSLVSLKEKKADVVGLMSCVLASIGWFVFGLIWPVVATDTMLGAVAYLWGAMGTIFAMFAIYTGMKMMGAIFVTEQPRQRLRIVEDRDEAED